MEVCGEPQTPVALFLGKESPLHIELEAGRILNLVWKF